MQATSYAKWIMTGEHAVIRNGKAIAFPLKKYKNVLTFSESDGKMSSALADSELSDLIRYACEYTKIPFKKTLGAIKVQTSIPQNAGLGSSAALCANIAKLFQFLGYDGDLIDLGRHLENKFHGHSSGLDVAASISEYPIVFRHSRIQKFIHVNCRGFISLTDCKKKSKTAPCVEKIQSLFEKNEGRALSLDNQMNMSSELCEEGLLHNNLSMLADGINLGKDTFKEWNLYCDELQQIEIKVNKDGALACKPIGAGLGGYMLSLWDHMPQQDYCDICLTLENS